MTSPTGTAPSREAASASVVGWSSVLATRHRILSARWVWGLLLIAASLFPTGVFILRYQRERHAVHELEAMGVGVTYWSPFPAWVSDYCGEHVQNPFSEVHVRLWHGEGMNLEEVNFKRLSSAIQDLRTVKALFLAGRAIDDTWLFHLKGMTNVRRLVIEGTNISDEGIAYLVKWRQLESLVLGPSERLSNRCLRHLEHMPSLRDLTVDVHANGITEEGISDLKKARPNLK